MKRSFATLFIVAAAVTLYLAAPANAADKKRARKLPEPVTSSIAAISGNTSTSPQARPRSRSK
jgi:hypothetical protein